MEKPTEIIPELEKVAEAKTVLGEQKPNQEAAVAVGAEQPLVEENGAKVVEKPAKKKAAEPDFFAKSSKDSGGLQAHFERFRRAKKQDIKYRNYVSQQSLVNRKDPQFKARLREKFVETAVKYFGVPYAGRYWKEGEKHHGAPLYLDCCALVRQVVYDLREDFGFQLDRWNQAYQFDTLPVDVPFEEMKPGDLVFYSGVYYNPKMRKQKHDMVHVEIFTGGETGEQSIGARWQRGVVQYFDSYKFTSTAYHSIVWHYKSIEPWLEGICKSHCAQHSWSSSNIQWAPGKKSIFSIDDEYDEADLDAPDLEEDMMGQAGEGEASEAAVPKKKQASAAQRTQVFIGQGNNPALPKDALINLGYKVMARGMLFSNEYRFKWTQTSMEINYMHFKEGVHIANHISNAGKVLTSKIATLEALENLRSGLANGTLRSELIHSVEEFAPETYRLDVVADLYQFLNSKTGGLWIEKKSQSNQGRGIRLIADVAKYREDLLVKKDVDKFDEAPADSTEMLIQKLDQLEATDGNGQKSPDQAAPEQKKWKNLNNLVRKLGGLVIQKYNENPSLINNRKYDVRYFMLIACTKPYLVLTHTGYARISLEEYGTEGFGSGTKEDRACHMTNASVQKFHPDFKAKKEETIMTMDQVREYMLANNPEAAPSAEVFDAKVIRRCNEICRLTFESVKDRLERKFGCFELFGLDFLLDEDLNPQLIEVNTNPALFTDTAAQAGLLPKLVDDTVKLALQLHPYGKADGGEEVRQFLEQGGHRLMQLPYDVVYRE